MELVNELLDKLAGIDPLVWGVLAAYLAPYAQEALKHVRDFGEKSNYIIAILVIPGIIGALVSVQESGVLAQIHPLVATAGTAGIVAIVSQLKYGLSLRPKRKLSEELESLRGFQDINKQAKENQSFLDASNDAIPKQTETEY